MFVSRYPHNLSLGEVEYKILRKLLAGTELTDEEEARADQMSRTLEQNETNAREPRGQHRHRMPFRNPTERDQREVEISQDQEQFASEQEVTDEQFSPS